MTTITGNDTYGIVPSGVTNAIVKSFDFQVRTITDYDVDRLQDRVVSEVFVNGHQTGVYAAAKVGDTFPSNASLSQAMHRFQPELERLVIDEFMGLGYRAQVRQLEYELQVLKAFVHRPRWWQFRPLRREVRRFRSKIANALAPKGPEDNPMEHEVR